MESISEGSRRGTYVAGDYSIVNMACCPWIIPHERQRHTFEDLPHLAAWFARIEQRPATERAAEFSNAPAMDEAAKRVLIVRTRGPCVEIGLSAVDGGSCRMPS